MKIKFSHILASTTIVLISLLSFASFAQDEGHSNELQEPNHQDQINSINDEDKTPVYEHDLKSIKNISSETHQNTVIIPAKGKTTEAHKPAATPNSSNTKEGDDALSFNFLFYIIQKYKFSDIIDQ